MGTGSHERGETGPDNLGKWTSLCSHGPWSGSLSFAGTVDCHWGFGISFSSAAAAAAAKLLQSCPTLCDPVDGSPPGSPVPGILQARTLEWGAISFSNA